VSIYVCTFFSYIFTYFYEYKTTLPKHIIIKRSDPFVIFRIDKELLRRGRIKGGKVGIKKE
jgi:hypothetical protein